MNVSELTKITKRLEQESFIYQGENVISDTILSDILEEKPGILTAVTKYLDTYIINLKKHRKVSEVVEVINKFI